MCTQHKELSFIKIYVTYSNFYHRILYVSHISSAGELYARNCTPNFEGLICKDIYCFDSGPKYSVTCSFYLNTAGC